MAVDNVLQFEVVTADGTKKTVNECQNPDLFWALRGGGGAFGVTTRVYFKTSPAPKAINTVVGRIECGDPKTYKDLINRIINIQVSLRNEGHVVLFTFPLKSSNSTNVDRGFGLQTAERGSFRWCASAPSSTTRLFSIRTILSRNCSPSSIHRGADRKFELRNQSAKRAGLMLTVTRFYPLFNQTVP